MIGGLHHIAIILSSEEELWFYELLGFRKTFRKKRENDTVVLMDGHGMQLEFFIDWRHPLHADHDEPFGLRHFALKIDGKIEDELERLRKGTDKPLEIGPILRDWSGHRFCFIRDPNGLCIELNESKSADNDAL